jgi:coproporphyrinogen III oxidase-like Fe-S oxidoreductase
MIDEYIVEYPAYAGAGSGAFGYLHGSMVTNLFSLDEYLARTTDGNPPTMFRRVFSAKEQFRYHLLMQMFRGVVDFQNLRETTGREWATAFVKAALMLVGAVKSSNHRYVVGEKASYLTVLLMKVFFEGVSSLRKLCMDYADGAVPVDQSSIDE